MQKSTIRERLIDYYDRLWRAALPRISSGQVDLDPVLQARLPDRRRGLTLIARPSAEVRQRVTKFLRELRAIEPEQHYYAPSELHLTILSLFTATVEHGPFLARQDEYVSAVNAAVRRIPPIRIQFRGVTASPGAVMIQGFFDPGGLTALRDALRRQLRRRDLAAGLDQRYRLETAHLTVVRFRSPLRDRDRWLAALGRSRRRAFGVTRITALALVKNDWYMTRPVLETIRRYRLQPSRSAAANARRTTRTAPPLAGQAPTRPPP